MSTDVTSEATNFCHHKLMALKIVESIPTQFTVVLSHTHPSEEEVKVEYLPLQDWQKEFLLACPHCLQIFREALSTRCRKAGEGCPTWQELAKAYAQSAMLTRR